MSLEDIKRSIKHFLSTDKPEVMCLRGKWGVGKTYLWDECLKESKVEGLLTANDYSYVSLFGMIAANMYPV